MNWKMLTILPILALALFAAPQVWAHGGGDIDVEDILGFDEDARVKIEVRADEALPFVVPTTAGVTTPFIIVDEDENRLKFVLGDEDQRLKIEVRGMGATMLPGVLHNLNIVK
ncbi:MAG: hypothetical protein UT54_C0044G0011 [Candidatus Daviesbacteria bacterium GW2011_GWB1_39_5]|nr:MAG: hypothetical protein UT54_C0044G0011 [Candidatus Daviesbacteria bacterium GW2011_GWB1_39_5]